MSGQLQYRRRRRRIREPDLLCQRELLLHPQELVLGRDQVLLQVLLRSGAGAETPFVIFLQSCHRVLQTADILSFNGRLEEPTNPKGSQLITLQLREGQYICRLSHYRVFTLALLEVHQSSLSSGFLIQCTHRLRESVRKRLPGYIRWLNNWSH